MSRRNCTPRRRHHPRDRLHSRPAGDADGPDRPDVVLYGLNPLLPSVPLNRVDSGSDLRRDQGSRRASVNGYLPEG
jgi:hypothetical protein